MLSLSPTDLLRSQDLVQSLLSQAINESIRNTHEEILDNNYSGCTMTSIFLLPTLHDSLLCTRADDNGERASASTLPAEGLHTKKNF